MYNEIKDIRQNLIGNAGVHPCISTIEDMNLSGLQSAGATFDVDPRFLAQHLQSTHWQYICVGDRLRFL
jgi:hypothetical protein